MVPQNTPTSDFRQGSMQARKVMQKKSVGLVDYTNLQMAVAGVERSLVSAWPVRLAMYFSRATSRRQLLTV